MNGIDLILDSNIVIYLTKEIITIDDIMEDGESAGISIITYMEVLGYNFLNLQQEAFVKELLNCFKIIFINKNIADTVIMLRKRYKIKLPDAIICATAINNNSFLVTNDKDLKVIDGLKIKFLSL